MGILDRNYSVRRPIQPYADIDDFRRQITAGDRHAEAYFQDHPEAWPCNHCNGWGWEYNTDETPVIQNGRKQFPKKDCKWCEGSRCGTKEESLQAYEGAITYWNIQARRYDDLVEAHEQAMGKLSPFEREALLTLGI